MLSAPLPTNQYFKFLRKFKQISVVCGLAKCEIRHNEAVTLAWIERRIMSNGLPNGIPDLAGPVEQGGAGQDFDTFFLEHHRALAGYLRRRVPTDEDAQEIVQESYTRLLNYGYGGSRPPMVWKSLLYRIATNLAYSRGRMDQSHNTAGQRSLDDVELLSDAPSQERVVAAQQELELVRQAIAGMTPKCRKVFLLSRTHRKTYPEIAQICGISVKMVEKYISQSLASLRQQLGGRP